MATKQDVFKTLTFLAALYPRFKLTPETGNSYAVILADIPADRLQQAAVHLGSTNTFFPSAAELRHAVFDLTELAHGVPTAGQAWAETCEMFSKGFSRYRPPADDDWSNPLVKDALRAIGGWRYLCESENLTADRARFIQAYQALVKRAQTETRMLPDVRESVERLASGEDAPQLPETVAKMRELAREKGVG